MQPLSEREAVKRRAFFETDDITNKAAVQGNLESAKADKEMNKEDTRRPSINYRLR